MAKTRALICPYCGDTQPVAEACRACGGLFEPLSRQATHNEMGPWYIRNPDRPFQPGCSYETLIKLIERGQITKFTILRGPTTKQYWTIARRVPGVSHLLGFCHNCDATVNVGDHGCHACAVPFGAYLDRNYLGLPEVRPLPWEPPADDGDGRMAVAATNSRQLSFRPAAEPLGISSFASDQELRGGGGMNAGRGATMTMPPMAAGGGGGGGGASMPGSFVDDRLGFTSAAVERPLHAGAAQSAERKMAQMQRVIRLLIGGLVVWGVVMIVIVMMMMDDRGGKGPVSNPTGSALEVTPETNDVKDVKSATDEPKDGQDVDGGAAVAPSTVAPIDVNLLLATANEHLRLAEQEVGPIQERIQSYEAALKLLREIETSATPEEKPDDLAERIKAVERALNDLKLKAFFP